ncbi:MAG: gfo/Idh/MocA family oxidoreductase, partial [Rhodobacteraceae bacterium]|nr:gfo/Idh/MocA family oxidoreductase [Paracoccaceae bacterium]
DKGGLSWLQEEPNTLWHSPFGEPTRKLSRGNSSTGEAAARVSRVPPGHPEGYLEGFANIYTEAALAIRAAQGGTDTPDGVIYPTIQDGLEGVAFVDACVRSSGRNGAWVKLAI